jgi:hypothetical protein
MTRMTTMTTMTNLKTKGKRPRQSHIFAREDHDFYVEPAWCSERLFAVEPFAGLIWDPAAGSASKPRPHPDFFRIPNA